MNVVTTLLYWTLLHKSQMKKYAGDPIRTFHQYTVHIIPAIAMAVNFCVTDVRMCPEHYIYLSGLCLTYGFVNFFTVRVLGSTPLYWFLDWRGIKSPLLIATITGFFSVAYIKLAELTWNVKPFTPIHTEL